MKIERVKLMIGKTINLGNYESARVDVGGEILLEATSPQEAYAELESICQRELQIQLAKIKG